MEVDEICPFLNPTKHAQLVSRTLGLAVGCVKARLCRQARNVLVPPCHRLLVASSPGQHRHDNIPSIMARRGVQQDFRTDFYKHRGLL